MLGVKSIRRNQDKGLLSAGTGVKWKKEHLNTYAPRTLMKQTLNYLRLFEFIWAPTNQGLGTSKQLLQHKGHLSNCRESPSSQSTPPKPRAPYQAGWEHPREEGAVPVLHAVFGRSSSSGWRCPGTVPSSTGATRWDQAAVAAPAGEGDARGSWAQALYSLFPPPFAWQHHIPMLICSLIIFHRITEW